MGDPTWMYRRRSDGGVEARVFDGGRLPPAAEGWRDSPAALPERFAGMSKKELEAYARMRFGVELDRRRSRQVLLRQVQELAAVEQREGRDGDGA